MPRRHPDRDEYYRFTGPMRLDKAVRTLEGVLTGIGFDRQTSPAELQALAGWIDEHRNLAWRHPFNELVPKLEAAIADGHLDEEEAADVLWLCGQMQPESQYFDQITADMQRLQGILGGIVADGYVADDEVAALDNWLVDNDHLKRCWPYDELESLLLEVRKDGQIDQRERELLLTFFSEFTTIRGNRALALPLNEVNTPITGLCAVCPEVGFDDHVFSFTGSSTRCTRTELAAIVEQYGGRFWPRITAQVDYLVIGADGNPCWAFSCYGRKVEQAIGLRKQGAKLLLVHENDFWDAVEDRKSRTA